MNNFNTPEEFGTDTHSRRHHDGHSPNNDGGFTDPREAHNGGHGFDGGEERPGHHRGGHHGHDDPRGAGRGFGRDFGPDMGEEFGRRGGPRGESRGDGADFGRGFGRRGPGFGAGGPSGFGPGMGGFGPGFGPGGFGPGFRGGFGRNRARKGNVRSAVLSLLAQHSFNGYGLIGAIAIHTDGAWRPSPGSIYPTLATLQAEGLIESTGKGKRTEFQLTESGKAYVAEHADEMAAVWTEVNEEAGAGTELRQSMGKLAGAVQQIGMGGTEEQIKSATESLDAARRAIYKLLAD
jgi:DNA-binding PadR family transcriptional regulator